MLISLVVPCVLSCLYPSLSLCSLSLLSSLLFSPLLALSYHSARLQSLHSVAPLPFLSPPAPFALYSLLPSLTLCSLLPCFSLLSIFSCFSFLYNFCSPLFLYLPYYVFLHNSSALSLFSPRYKFKLKNLNSFTWPI